MNEKKAKESSLLTHYQQTLDRYNDTVEAEVDEMSEEGKERIVGRYEECRGDWESLYEQRELNRNTFRVICDNYCVSDDDVLIPSESASTIYRLLRPV